MQRSGSGLKTQKSQKRTKGLRSGSNVDEAHGSCCERCFDYIITGDFSGLYRGAKKGIVTFFTNLSERYQNFQKWFAVKRKEQEQRAMDKTIEHTYPRIRKIVHTNCFEIVGNLVIFANTFVVGWQAELLPHTVTDRDKLVSTILENFFTFAFVVELSLSTLCWGWTSLLERENWMDVFLVFLGVLTTWILGPFGIEVDFLRKLTALRTLRLIRLARAVRLRPEFKEMWALMKGLTDSGETLFWTYVMIFCVLYFFAIIATSLIGKAEAFQDDALAQEYFGDVILSMLSLFQLMTLDSWTGFARPLMEKQVWVELADFDDLWHRYPGRIPDSLWANMQKCGFKTPTPVQRYAIPIGLEGRDMMCSAQTGSGKTAAFLIPMLASMIKHHKAVGSLEEPFQGACKPDTLILTPTRELCMQTYEDALRFCYNTPHRCYRVYGQQNAKTQLTELAKGADLIVATVGRLYDFVRAGIINLEDVNCLVLDEADRMLDMGFQEQIKEIVESHKMPSKDHRQTMMFSATFPDSVQEMAKDYLHDFLMIVVGSAGSPAVTVTQCVEKVDKAEKEQKLTDFVTEVLKRDPDNRILVFTNSKNSAKFLDEKLYAGTATTAALHGDLDQPKREEHLESFRRGTVDIMIATDVASRGLDISRVTHVVNYDAPKEISLYVHRIGRTGRIGHRGTALTYITYEDSWCMDSDDFLRDLPDVMQGAPNTWVPDWLQELSDSKKGDVWNYKKPEWGTSDVRDRGNEQSGFQGWGESTQDATNQDWSAWNGTNGNAGANGNSNNWNNNNSWN